MQGGGRLNRKNIVVSRHENALNKGKSPNFDTAKNTPKAHINYGKNDGLNCSQLNNENCLLTQRKNNGKTNFLNKKDCSQSSFINISLFGERNKENNLFGKKNNGNNKYELNQNNNETTQKTNNKNKIFALIFSLFFIFSTLLTSGVFLIVNYVNKGNATTSYTSIGNMLKDANTINGTIYKKLLTKLGNDTTSTRKKSEINDGTSVVFKMGTVNNNSIYWQVVYQAGDIITVWMTDPYTAEYYNKSGGSINNSALLGYSTGQYSDNANYSRSILRDVTKAIYKEMATSFPVIANVVKTPSNANQTYQIGDNTYNKPTKFQYSAYHPLYYSHHNGLRDETSLDTAYYDYDWNTSNTPYTDEFWIPSWFEAFNYNNSSSGDNRWFDGGYWGLSSTDVGFSSYTSSPLNGIGAVNSNCWFRSGYSNGSHYGTLVDTSGSGVGDGVSYSRGVRPACHLSLSAMAATFPSTVTLDLQSGSGGTTSVQAIYGSAMPAITIPTRASYIFGGYYTGTNGSGTQYYTESGTSARNWDISGDTTLYAKWTAITYNLILNVNNSNFGTILNSGGSLMEGTTYTTAAVPKTNCAFLYWIDSSAPTVPIYDNPLTITVTSDKTYTAYFTDSLVEGVSVDATFGGSAEILHTTDTTSLADSDTLTLIARLRYSGYQFDGWFIQGETNAFSTDMSVSVQYGTIKNKIIIAKFSKISASINDDTENSNDFV